MALLSHFFMAGGVSGLLIRRWAAMRVSWMCSLLLQAKVGVVERKRRSVVRRFRSMGILPMLGTGKMPVLQSGDGLINVYLLWRGERLPKQMDLILLFWASGSALRRTKTSSGGSPL